MRSFNKTNPTKRKRVAKIEEDLRVANKKLKALTNEFKHKKSCKALSSTLTNIPSSSSSSSNGITETAPQRKTKKKAWENCSSQYQKRTRETIKNINTAITYTENEDFKPK